MKKTILLTDKAVRIYDSLKPHKKSEYVSDAIIEKSERESRTLTLTEADKQWIMDKITEAVHACYRG